MTTPSRPVPGAIDRWISRRAWLRVLDAFLAWGAVLMAIVAAVGSAPIRVAALLSIIIVLVGAAYPKMRGIWRPVSASVGLALSRNLKPGDRAWYVRPGRADLVLVTARRGVRVTIVPPEPGVDEVVSVRRTRVLLMPTGRDS